jgi:hypothetical protein
MSPLKAAVAAVLALATGPFAGVPRFAADVPPDIPATSGWERISGDLEFENPRFAVQYEFFVNPARPAAYEVVRYRVTDLGVGAGRRPGPGAERLQWDRNGRDLRRFECVPDPRGGCAWREMEKGGEEYLREVPFLLWLYSVHRSVARDREHDVSATHLASPRRTILTSPAGG